FPALSVQAVLFADLAVGARDQLDRLVSTSLHIHMPAEVFAERIAVERDRDRLVRAADCLGQFLRAREQARARGEIEVGQRDALLRTMQAAGLLRLPLG